MNKNFNLVHLCVLISVSSFISSSDMESVLEVGRENQELSAASQDNIDATEKKTDKIVNEWKATAKQVEGLKLYNEKKRNKTEIPKIKRRVLFISNHPFFNFIPVDDL